MVAALFLVNRGYASIRQEDGMDGKVILSDLHPEEKTSTFYRAASSPREISGGLKMENDALPTVIEAILFGSGRSMTVSEIALASQSDESDGNGAQGT